MRGIFQGGQRSLWMRQAAEQAGRGLLCAILFAGAATAYSALRPPTDPAGWRGEAMAEALQAIDAVADPYQLAQVLTEAARAQLLMEDADGAEASLRRALDIADRIAAPEFKGWALRDIVVAQLAADDLIGARQTVELITSDRPQGAALAAIADVQLRGGNLDKAQATAGRIRDKAAAGAVLYQVTALQLARGELSAARATVRRIDDRFYEAVALGEIAFAEITAGNLKRAETAAAQAQRKDRGQVWARIAVASIQRGDRRTALDALAEIDDVFERTIVQGQLAALSAAKDKAGSAELQQQAFQSLATARERDRVAVTLAQLARLQAVAGDREGARGTLQRALAATAEIKAQQQRDAALELIARNQVRLGDYGAALDLTPQIANRISQALLVRDIAAGQLQAGATLAEIDELTPTDEPLVETAVWFGVLGTQLEMRSHHDAAASIGRAAEAVRAIEDEQLKPAAFASLAAARVTLGDVEGGRQLFQEGLAAGADMVRPAQRASAYIHMVSALNDRLMFLGQPASSAENSNL